ncbi:MAG: hypothetical protein GY739_12240 [Mesoflavibacter sp.]|nr:hypothetical protein [Mesoflavibacter sp.]
MPLTEEEVLDLINDKKEGMQASSALPPPPLSLEEIYKKLDYLKDENIKTKVAELLYKYDSCATHALDSGTSIVDMDFPVPDNFVKNTKIYNLSLLDTQHLRHFVDLCIKYDILELAPSHLQFGSPVFVVPRKNRQDSPRIVVDSRGVNASVTYNTSSITLDPINTLKHILPHVKFACFMDIKSAFYNLKLSQKVLDTGVSNIVTSFGTFRFKRAITGYSGTPSLLIHYILSNIHLDNDNIASVLELLVVFFDDLSLFCWRFESIDTMLQKLDNFLSRLNRINLKLNLDKCRFMVDLDSETIDLLGYTIGKGRISVPDKKIQTISKLESPKTLKDLQSFLGNLTYFRNLLPLNIHASMNALYSQVKNFQWDNVAEQHFNIIKSALSSQSLYNDSRLSTDIQFLYTDASANALGSCLLGLSLQEFIVDKLPIMSPLPHGQLSNYFQNNPNIGTVDDSSNLAYLFYKISLYLKREKDISFSDWYNVFTQTCVLNTDLSNVLYNPSWDPDYIPSNQDYQKLYLDTMNQIRVGATNCLSDCPSLITFLLQSYSRYIKRNIKIFFLHLGQVKEVNICVAGPETIDSSIHLYFEDNIYYYLALRCDINLEDQVYKRTTREISLDDRELYNLTEKALRTNDFRLKGKVKVLGFFSKSVSESLINTTTIAYLEILSILESLQFFETEIQLKKTLVLTDSAACNRILANKKIQSKKSKLDVLSQKIIFWFGTRISFLTIPTKQQLADFVSRLIPQSKNILNFQPQINPIYEGDLFQVFEPKLIARDKTNFVSNIIHEPDNQFVKAMTTRGKAPELLQQYDQMEGKGRKRKVKDKENHQDRLTDLNIPVPTVMPNNDIKDEFVQSSDVNLDSKSDKNSLVDNTNFQTLPFANVEDNVSINSDNLSDKSKISQNVAKSLLNNESQKSETPESMVMVIPDPIFRNRSIMSGSDRATLVSSNEMGLNPYLGLMDQNLNKPYTKDEIGDLNDLLIDSFQEKINASLQNKDNSIQSSIASEDSTPIKVSMTPDYGQAINNARIFNRSTFIHLQILENLSNDVNPTTLKFKDGLIILPQILYSLFAALTHNNLIHCGANRLENQIRKMYYVAKKTQLSKICNAIVVNCLVCIKAKNSHFRLERGSSLHRTSFYRNHTVAMDILEFPKVLGPGTQVDGLQGLAVYMDVCTQFLSVYLLRNMTQIEVQHTFASYIMSHGRIKYFWTDNARNIRSPKNAKFIEELGSKFLHSAPYRSASRGNIENRIKIIQNVLRICNVFKSKIHILNSLSASIFVLNTTKLYNTNLSPYNLHYLSLYNFSGNLTNQDEFFQASFSYDEKSLETRMLESKDGFKELYNKVKELILNRQTKLLEKLNKNRHPHNYTVGDLVFVRLDNLKQQYFHKNRPLYDLYLWRVTVVKKLIIHVTNLVTGEEKVLSPQQLKKLQQDKLDIYQLPAEVKKYFRLLRVEDVQHFNQIQQEIQKLGKENLSVSLDSLSDLSSIDTNLHSLDDFSDLEKE